MLLINRANIDYECYEWINQRSCFSIIGRVHVRIIYHPLHKKTYHMMAHYPCAFDRGQGRPNNPEKRLPSPSPSHWPGLVTAGVSLIINQERRFEQHNCVPFQIRPWQHGSYTPSSSCENNPLGWAAFHCSLALCVVRGGEVMHGEKK